MCLRDVLRILHANGVRVTESQVRWGIVSGKVSRPRLDGSLRFVFDHQHVEEIRQLMKERNARRKRGRARVDTAVC